MQLKHRGQNTQTARVADPQGRPQPAEPPLTAKRYVYILVSDQHHSSKGTPLYVALYRNLNLGHRGSPNREQLEDALASCGARRVKSFQTNGTVLLDTDTPLAIVELAGPVLRDCCGYDDAVFVQSIAQLDALVALGIFEAHPSTRTYRECVTFFRGPKTPEWVLPWTNPKDDVDILYCNDGVALSLTRKPRNTAGNPTAVLERATQGVATTRTLGTIQRLLKTAASW